MSDLLLELRSEEIPARMQAKGAELLRGAVESRLKDRGLDWKTAEAFATPRRLALIVRGLPAGVPASREERRGPRVGAPEKALAGFLRSTDLTREMLEMRGEGADQAYFAVWDNLAQPLHEVLAVELPQALRAMTWPKSMRWGRGNFRWVRPLRSIVCIVDDDTGSRVVELDVEGIPCGRVTCGHPYMAPDEFTVESVDKYEDRLEKANVILRAENRRKRIDDCVFKAALGKDFDFELVEDSGLLDEITGLVEWPVVHIGRIEDVFSDLPDEVLQVSMRRHQKFFSLRNLESQRIVGFAAVADIKAADGGARILEGYERVLRARLADARFFWENDLRTGIEAMRSGLSEMGFHPALGSMEERTVRISALAAKITRKIGGPPPKMMHRAGELAKADLCSEMVREFPELQGIVGARLAEEAGEDQKICEAVKRQYSPIVGPDDIPSPVAAALVLADRADMLWGFFAVGERPTGSRDPYALRRAALAILRTLIENKIHFPLHRLVTLAEKNYGERHFPYREDAHDAVVKFMLERLRVYLREHKKGHRYDLIAAAARRGAEDDPYRFLLRVQALEKFFVLERSSAADQLLATYRRAANIVDVEDVEASDLDSGLYLGEEERSLAEALDKVEGDVLSSIEKDVINSLAQDAKEKADESPWDAVDALVALPALGQLSDPIKHFFENVHVNDPDPDLRRHRHRLLVRLRAMMERVADFGEIVD